MKLAYLGILLLTGVSMAETNLLVAPNSWADRIEAATAGRDSLRLPLKNLNPGEETFKNIAFYLLHQRGPTWGKIARHKNAEFDAIFGENNGVVVTPIVQEYLYGVRYLINLDPEKRSEFAFAQPYLARLDRLRRHEKLEINNYDDENVFLTVIAKLLKYQWEIAFAYPQSEASASVLAQASENFSSEYSGL